MRGSAAGAAKAVGKGFGPTGCPAFGAFDGEATDGLGGGVRSAGGGQVGRDLCDEATPDEADG